MILRTRPAAAAAALASLVACAGAAVTPATPGDRPREHALTADEQAAAARLTAASIAAPLAFLADDLLEGREPGTRGGALAAKFIAAEMQGLGLEPGGDSGTYFQKVPLVGVTPELPKTVTFQGARPESALTLRMPEDFAVSPGVHDASVAIRSADVVFVGYGIVAPEYQWDDYKGIDVRGKVVLVMNDDPSSDPNLFGGKTRLWYGRWDYKYEQAAKKGAAGCIIIHTTPSAAWGWQVVEASFGHERFDLPPAGEPRLQAAMWATEDASRRLVTAGGKDLDRLRAAAESRDFHAVPLDVRLDLAFTNTIRKLESVNVAGVLRGSDAARASESVVFTAHHDHLGIGRPVAGDTIYNGAVDNASGVATILAIARAAVAAGAPRRSMLFLAVAAEEQGLLGSQYYCAHPTFAPGRIAADINVDSVNRFGRTSDLGFTGYGKSSLDGIVESVAHGQGRTVHGDPHPENGSFYRSDQFNFAKIGVPSIYLRGGPTYVGRPAGWGEAVTKEFTAKHYHQPSDQFDASWDLSGAVEDAQLLFLAGMRIANDDALPAWKPGDEFEAARKRAIAGP